MSTSTPSTPPQSPPPSASRQAVAVQQAVAAYAGTFTDIEAAVAQRNPQSPVLRGHATGPALTQLGLAVQSYLTAGYVPAGAPALNARATSVNTTGNPPEVTLLACPSPAKYVSTSTGSPTTVKIVSRAAVAVTLEQQGGSWRVYYVQPDKSQPCTR